MLENPRSDYADYAWQVDGSTRNLYTFETSYRWVYGVSPVITIKISSLEKIIKCKTMLNT